MLGQDIQRVSDLPGFVGVNFMGVSAEFRYLVMRRTADVPIQLTLTAQPEYHSIADAGRETVDFSTTFRAIADAISSDRRLYGAINLVYAPDGLRLPGQLRQDTAILAASAALSYRLTPPLMFGAEADYDRAYGGLVPRGFRGQAAYFGPTFHYQINEKIDLSAAFLIQAPAGRLDFDDFPRQLAKLETRSGFLTWRRLPRQRRLCRKWSDRPIGPVMGRDGEAVRRELASPRFQVARCWSLTATPSPIDRTTRCRKPFAAAMARARAPSSASPISCCGSMRMSGLAP